MDAIPEHDARLLLFHNQRDKLVVVIDNDITFKKKKKNTQV